MDEAHVVPERGVLTASSVAWDLAVRRAEVIGRLAGLDEVGHRCADEAAAEFGLSRRQVYVLLRRWRQGEGVVSDMLPGRSSSGRGREHLLEAVEAVIREVLRTRYLTKQRRSMSAVHREVTRLCRGRGLPSPSRGALGGEARSGGHDAGAGRGTRPGRCGRRVGCRRRSVSCWDRFRSTTP
ncbi:MAG TPA: helix-turn-helix domain-containing protein [Actinoplanes sp.]|nr:helix-turn-helix domain-containing protein [Actinoplanes sp.]